MGHGASGGQGVLAPESGSVYPTTPERFQFLDHFVPIIFHSE